MQKIMRFIFSILALLFVAAPVRLAAEPPKLVVNIVVSQMRYDYMARFAQNLDGEGFRQFIDKGMIFTDARYNFMQTTTPATLATLTTGADPSTHGVVSERWIDYTTNQPVFLIDDRDVWGVGCDAGLGNHSPKNIIVPTLGDRLREYDTQSKIITVAMDPVSAVVMGGQNSDVYWLDATRGCWSSSTAYMSALPTWVDAYNRKKPADQWLEFKWELMLPGTHYLNSAYSAVSVPSLGNFRKVDTPNDPTRKRNGHRDFERLLYTPIGNTLVGDFVRSAIVNEDLGKDEHTDILNICFDTPRYVGRAFGGESLELEDMFYRLDQEIRGLLNFISQLRDMKDVVVVLTSDHGASDSYDYGRTDRERFNAAQFKVIMNGFMNAQYGAGEWVVDYVDRQLYFNRNLIYQNGLSLEEVQNRVAAFALQFRGVSHVLTSTAMQMSYFSGSYAEKMQNSFYPRRSGDLTINLMPGWIEEEHGVRASSGSMYEYDVHVPLMFIGARFSGQRVTRTINMRDVASTLAHIMEISRPIAAEGEPIEEIKELY